jgi:hypothetical protein
MVFGYFRTEYHEELGKSHRKSFSNIIKSVSSFALFDAQFDESDLQKNPLGPMCSVGQIALEIAKMMVSGAIGGACLFLCYQGVRYTY